MKLYGKIYSIYSTLDFVVVVENKDGKRFPARPEPCRSFVERLVLAWDVLTYKADALYWEDR